MRAGPGWGTGPGVYARSVGDGGGVVVDGLVSITGGGPNSPVGGRTVPGAWAGAGPVERVSGSRRRSWVGDGSVSAGSGSGRSLGRNVGAGSRAGSSSGRSGCVGRACGAEAAGGQDCSAGSFPAPDGVGRSRSSAAVAPNAPRSAARFRSAPSCAAIRTGSPVKRLAPSVATSRGTT